MEVNKLTKHVELPVEKGLKIVKKSVFLMIFHRISLRGSEISATVENSRTLLEYGKG